MGWSLELELELGVIKDGIKVCFGTEVSYELLLKEGRR